MRESTRERLVSAAAELFYRHGIQATSIDAIVEAARLTKPTLYQYFRSKDELIAAVLQRRDREQRRRLDEMCAAAATLEERLLAPFRQVVEWGRAGDYRGCALVAAAVELPDPDHPGREVVRRYKGWLEDYFREAAAELPQEAANRLAGHLVLLLEGGAVQQGTLGGEHGLAALEVARAVIDRAQRETA